MIDLHSHTLPGLCDGSQSLETSLEMARMAVKDGTTHLACTPHVYPGVYDNSEATIRPALKALQYELDSRHIPLRLLIGADTHMVPEAIHRLKARDIPTLNDSRYFLLEPSHHVPVVNFLDQVENYLNAGYVPLITHPERLHWIESHYDLFIDAARLGAWIQITSGAITGRFGKRAKNFSERFLKDGFVHVIASDAHGTVRRPPILSEGVAAAVSLLGDEDEVMRMVVGRPQAILENAPAVEVSMPSGLNSEITKSSLHIKKGWFAGLFS